MNFEAPKPKLSQLHQNFFLKAKWVVSCNVIHQRCCCAFTASGLVGLFHTRGRQFRLNLSENLVTFADSLKTLERRKKCQQDFEEDLHWRWVVNAEKFPVRQHFSKYFARNVRDLLFRIYCLSEDAHCPFSQKKSTS